MGGAGSPPAPAPGTRLSAAGSPGYLRMCQLGTTGRSQGRAAGNGAVSLPQILPPGGVPLRGLGTAGDLRNDGVPGAAPSAPKPSLGLSWGCRGGQVSRSHFPSRGRDRDWGHVPHSGSQSLWKHLLRIWGSSSTPGPAPLGAAPAAIIQQKGALPGAGGWSPGPSLIPQSCSPCRKGQTGVTLAPWVVTETRLGCAAGQTAVPAGGWHRDTAMARGDPQQVL